jgi:hypothetical protein
MIEVWIEKPLYANFVYVRDRYIKEAEVTGQMLHIATPKGERTCTPQEWLDGAKRMEKQFRFPEPMILWGNYVTPSPKRISEIEEVEGQQSLL